MSDIPNDIKLARARASIFEAAVHKHFPRYVDVCTINDALDAYVAERQRQAEVMEEVRKVADLVVNNPAFFTTTYEERPYATITFDNAEAAHRFNDGLIGLRALLSRMEER